ncbi:MAG: DUF11 domain-containing protein [Betaproteobacteria bacterium]|nr:DUF11 domain-containing protein [Betaproteobacteria bacterium]
MRNTCAFFGIVARAALAAAVFVSLLLLPAEAHAARIINSVTLNGAPSVTVSPGAAITAVVNVSTTGAGTAQRWRSTGWLIATAPPGSVTCVDHPNHDAVGTYSETFSITAPATPGTYNAYFIAYNNDTCSSGASATYTLTNGVIVVTNPVPTTTSISPASKNVGDATFTLTVNGTNLVAGSVVNFAGSPRTTSYVSATQLTATIPASDLTIVGTYNITVFNPTPGGGTSNVQTFTVNPGMPMATTNTASGVTVSDATLNGTVNTRGANTTVTFQYGLTTAYGNSITATPSPVAPGSGPYPNVAVSASLNDLNCNTLFHYRVVATNSAGTTNGLDGTFTTGACLAPFPPTACAATRYGSDLSCAANDVSVTNIALAPGSFPSCVSGTPVTLDLDLIVNFASPDRYDVGIFIANDGKLPTVLPANGGAGSCSVGVLPITPPFLDLDGVPQGTADTCGDGNSSIDDSALPGGTVPLGDGVRRMTGVTLPCYASAASGGKLFVPYTITWSGQRSPIGSVCTSNQWPVPGTSAKCSAPASTVSVDIVVKPVITKTNGGTTINPGANTTYTVVITNNSGGTLLDSVFKDPAVTDLTVNNVSCAATGGASCPAATVAAMQGAGIAIPSASLPDNSSLTFTINATVSATATVGSHLINTATVTVGGHTNSAADDDLVVIAASAATSFSPGTITEGGSSVLTVTLTNPTGSAVTSVAFTDTYPSGLVNTASAGGATTCGGTVTAANGGNSLALSGGTIPASGSCTVTVNVTSATAGSYANSTGTVTHSLGSISAASATLTVNVPVFGGFNACNVAAAPNASCTSTTTVTNSRITSRIAGSAFSLDLVALNTNGTRNTSYNSTVQVQLLDASNNGGALDSYNCRSTWTVITTLSPNPAFDPKLNGLLTVGPFTVPEAYRDVRVRVSNVGGSTRIGCSTDNFAIRPNGFTVSATDSNWTTAGTTRAINNTDATSPGSSTTTPYPIHKAGQAFTVTATAKNASNVTTANYNVTVAPAAALSVCTPGTACTASLGTLTLGTPIFTPGVVTWNSATYSEVGAFDLALQDTDFASVDAADTEASCAGRYVCGNTSVGRFVPDHFDLSGATIVNRSDVNAGSGCSPASAFTYMGEPMKASFTLAAKNAGGNTTQNYVGGLAKFTGNWTTDTGSDRVGLWMMGQNYAVSPGTCKVLFSNATPSVTSYACTGVGNPASINRSAGPRVTVAASPPADISWASGIGTFSAHATLERADSPDGSYDTIHIGVAPVDADGVTVQSSALNLDADNDAANERVSLGTTGSRFGILKLDSAYGSELLAIRVPLSAMYWNASAFIANADDSCTQIAPANLAIGNYKGSLNGTNMGSSHLPGSPITLSGGNATITATKPSPAAVGSVDLAINLGATSGDANCIGGGFPAAASGTDFAWLRGSWCGTAFVRDPNARITFGSSRRPFIFLREMY